LNLLKNFVCCFELSKALELNLKSCLYSPRLVDPCHNVFNPLIAALFSGNALVIKASE